MKKFYLLTKTLLAAVLLCVGQNAWAADTFLTTWTGQVGTATNSGNFKYATKKINIAAGETYVYTLTNFNDGNNSNYWKNWVVEGNLGDKYFDCEARGHQWQAGGGPVPSYLPIMAYTDVENFQTAYNGANVTITVSRNAAGDQFTVTHTSNVLGTTDGNTDKYYGGTWTVAVGPEEEWDIYITEEEAHFVVTNVTYTDAESNVTNYNPVYEHGYVTAWSTSDVTTTENTENKWYCANGISKAEANSGMRINTTYGLNNHVRGNATNIAELTLNKTKDIISIDAIWNVGGAGTTPQYAGYTQFQYGDFKITYYPRNRETSYTINGRKTTVTSVDANSALSIHLKVNSVSGSISEFEIVNGSTSLATFSDLTDANNTFAGGANYSKIITTSYHNASSVSIENYVTSLLVTEEASGIATATVTFKYEDTEGNSLSSYHIDANKEAAVGSTISDIVTSDLTATFYNGTSNKYVYADSYIVTGDYTTVQEGGNTVTLKFTDYPATAYTVKAQVSGSDLTTLASGSAYFDGSTTAYWSKYINFEDKWYVADVATYGAVITTATNNVAFTATDDIDYFFEAEDMTYSRIYNEYSGTAASNGSAKTLYGDAKAVTETTVPAGVYTISLNGIKWQDGYADNYQIAYSVDKTNWVALGNIAYADGEGGVKTLVGAIIPRAAYIRIWTTLGSQTPRRYLDYMTLKKTADLPATENIVVTAAGYATYVSNYNLDFSSATTKAYKVNVASKGVATLTEVAKVPAKTPVLLYVAGGNGEGEAIPVTTDAVDAVTGNNLVAGTGAAVATTDGDYTNMILNNIDSKIGFYFANSQTVATNRAYLHIATSLAPDAVGASRMVIVFGEESTGISATLNDSGEMINDKVVYDLQGRRVTQPTKGLYIVNGKKVVIK